MVLQGQYLERPTLIQRLPADEVTAGLTLEGLYHRGDRAPAVVICAPHPRMGGSMDSPVVAELAWALTRRGHATLRFNYQGVGASAGELQTPAPAGPGAGPLPLRALASELGDAAAAVRHLAACVGHGRVAVAGYSFGAGVALALALEDPELSHLLLVAPPNRMLDFTPLAAFDRPLFVAAGQHDTFVDRPALSALIAGRRNVRFELLAGVDHAFTRGLTELGASSAAWLDARPA